jgi:RNA polymerase-binding transcription factor DksA
LSPLQRERLARRRREEHARVLRALGALEQDAVVDRSHSIPAADGRSDGEFGAQEVSRLARELEDIGAALESVSGESVSGESEPFGCDEPTDEEIPLERLDHVHWAREHAGDPSTGAAKRRAIEADLRAAERNEHYAG